MARMSINWSSYETSDEIGSALEELFGDQAEAVWDSPTPEQDKRVIALAWSKAADYTTELYWGESIIKRG